MKSKIKSAYSEVYEILQLIDDEYINKVPEKFIEFIKKERDTEYIANINPNVPLEEQNLLKETINILALLKLDYWCKDEEEKKELLNILNQNEEEYQEELRRKYSPDNIFRKDREKLQDNNEENVLVEYKEQSFIKRLFEKIKNLFKRKFY